MCTLAPVVCDDADLSFGPSTDGDEPQLEPPAVTQDL